MIEEGSMTRLYRPVFQYEDNGVLLTASKVSYEYERDVEIGDSIVVYSTFQYIVRFRVKFAF